MMALLLSLSVAHATERVVVHSGDTVEIIAAAAGDPNAASAIRSANGLEPGVQPLPGTILVLPDALSGVSHDAAVLGVYGGASAQIPGVGTADLEAGMPLPPGSRVCTESDGYATIRLAVSERSGYHDDITMLPGTCLTIEATVSRRAGRSSLVALGRGSVTIPRLGEGESAGRIAVSTEAGVTSARGGGFRVHVESDDAARTEALHTPLSVFGAGVELSLLPGQGSRVRLGEHPGAAVDLPPSSAPELPPHGAILRRPDFSWSHQDVALGYQLELASGPGFRSMLLVERVDRPLWEPERLLLPGDVEGIWWRVSSVDRHGFIGVPSTIRRLDLPPGVRP